MFRGVFVELGVGCLLCFDMCVGAHVCGCARWEGIALLDGAVSNRGTTEPPTHFSFSPACPHNVSITTTDTTTTPLKHTRLPTMPR